jgi:hypothetical protein
MGNVAISAGGRQRAALAAMGTCWWMSGRFPSAVRRQSSGACRGGRQRSSKDGMAAGNRRRHAHNPDYILVFIGAGLGGALRHAVNAASIRQFG